MWTIKQPPKIIFGQNSVKEYEFLDKYLIITSKGAKSRGWLDYSGLTNHIIFDNVEPNPSIKTTEKIISKFKDSDFTHIIGIGGGSSMDVAKFCAFKMNKLKIMIPTTFGSGSEVTRISVLKVDGKKKSFHDDKIFADVAIVDSYFLDDSSDDIIKNAVIDACAQATEAHDSKLANPYTKLLCENAFNILEKAILNKTYKKLPLGSLICGLGFGNSSTTLGHALAFTTQVAHKFNKSKFYERFKKIVDELNFSPIKISTSLDEAAELILRDRKHLDNNPYLLSKIEIINLLNEINLFQRN